MKRKTILAIVMAGTMLLIACGAQSDADVDPAESVEDITVTTPSEDQEEAESSQEEENVPLPEETDQEDSESSQMKESASEPEGADEEEITSVGQVFTAVLLNEIPVFCTDRQFYQNTYVVHEYTDYLKDLPNPSTGSNENMLISRFAVVDMDGDALPEIVLETIDNNGYENGYCILRYRQGEVCGYVIGLRSLENLREDGTHMGDAGAGDIWIEKLYFIKDTVVHDARAHMEEVTPFYSYYTLHDILVDESVWNETEASFYATPEAEWHEYTEESVREWVTENTVFDVLLVDVAEISERQSYLDSLSYLGEMTYDTGLLAGDDWNQYRIDAKQYYENCMYEMDRIYGLCEEKLSGQELADLQAEQQYWQNGFDSRLSQDLNDWGYTSIEAVEGRIFMLYYSYGDILFRRTLSLVNRYYDCHFYG